MPTPSECWDEEARHGPHGAGPGPLGAGRAFSQAPDVGPGSLPPHWQAALGWKSRRRARAALTQFCPWAQTQGLLLRLCLSFCHESSLGAGLASALTGQLSPYRSHSPRDQSAAQAGQGLLGERESLGPRDNRGEPIPGEEAGQEHPGLPLLQDACSQLALGQRQRVSDPCPSQRPQGSPLLVPRVPQLASGSVPPGAKLAFWKRKRKGSRRQATGAGRWVGGASRPRQVGCQLAHTLLSKQPLRDSAWSLLHGAPAPLWTLLSPGAPWLASP